MDEMNFTQSGATESRWYPLNSRWLSAVELLVASFIVIAHNVYHIVPNEVLVLFPIAWISFRLRDGGFGAIGLKRPSSWKWSILIALAAAAFRILLGEYVIDPLTGKFWPPAIPPAGIDSITGNWKMALLTFGLVWTFAAFGEEIDYRGYILTRAADLGKRSTTAYWIGMIVSSVLFGIGHYYKGPSGMIDSGIAGVILGTAYLLSGRNLWVCILVHGFIDTFGLILVFLGLDS